MSIHDRQVERQPNGRYTFVCRCCDEVYPNMPRAEADDELLNHVCPSWAER